MRSEGGEHAHQGPARAAKPVQARGEADTWPLSNTGSGRDRWWDSALAWRERGLAHWLDVKMHSGKAKGHWVIVGWGGHCGLRVIIIHLIEHVMCTRYRPSAYMGLLESSCRPYFPEEPVGLQGGA